MVSSFTTNKHIEKPGNNDYVDTWNVPVNSDWDTVDKALGGMASLTVTSLAGTYVLGFNDYQALIISITGTLTANVTYEFPSGVGGQWIVANNSTGAFKLTFASAGGGTSVNVAQGYNTLLASDGTNVKLSNDSPTTTAGATTQVIYNNGSVFAGSINLTFDGTDLTCGGVIYDAIGDVRTVPANAQTSAYVLAAADSGKYVSITTGGVTVPQNVFFAGDTITIYNNSSASQTITQGGGVTLRLVGTATIGNRTLAQYGVATVLCVGTNVFVITGAGLS